MIHSLKWGDQIQSWEIKSEYARRAFITLNWVRIELQYLFTSFFFIKSIELYVTDLIRRVITDKDIPVYWKMSLFMNWTVMLKQFMGIWSQSKPVKPNGLPRKHDINVWEGLTGQNDNHNIVFVFVLMQHTERPYARVMIFVTSEIWSFVPMK